MTSKNTLGSSVYRGRLAPSTTGWLHLGHARTFWTAADRVRQAAGTLVLREEDLDPHRSKNLYAEAMLEDLRWLGLGWQEGPDVGGPFAPYSQSRRRPLYLAAWRQLVAQGSVYPCACSRRDLHECVRAPHEQSPGIDGAQGANGAKGAKGAQGVDAAEQDEPMYPGTCRPIAMGCPAAVPASPGGVNWRFRVPQGEQVCFEDGRFGRCSFTAGRDFGDFLVWRRDAVPAYQLAVVVDDAAMRITEVVRGADLLRSTARQLLLYRALDLPAPAWFHCPLVVDAAGQRLAKRSDALSIRALRASGRTPSETLTLAAAATLG